MLNWKLIERDENGWKHYHIVDSCGKPVAIIPSHFDMSKDVPGNYFRSQRVIKCVNEFTTLQSRSDMLEEVVGALEKLLEYTCKKVGRVDNDIESPPFRATKFATDTQDTLTRAQAILMEATDGTD